MRLSAIAGRYVVLLVASLVATAAMAQDAMPDTADIQRALVKHGYNVGSVDGLWGRRSINALAAFQKAEGLPATGEPDRATISRLLQPRQSGPSSSPDAVSVPAPGNANSPVLEKPASFPSPTAQAAKPAASASSELPAKSSPTSSLPAPAADQSPEAAPSRGQSFGWIIGIVASLGIIGLIARRRGGPTRAENKNSIGAGGAGRLRTSHGQHSESVPAVSAAKAVPVLSNTLQSSLDAHNAIVGRAIRRGGISVHLSKVPPKNEDAIPRDLKARATTESANTLANDMNRRLPIQNAEAERATAGQESDPDSAHQAGPSLMVRLAGSVPRHEPAPADGWIPAGHPVRIGTQFIAGGMIYVGRHLPQQGNGHQTENCLINPDLAVAMRKGDPHGVTMGYWPSYSTISAEARRSYLEWLTGPRSDPWAYIGYVFLYFYGLERRLMLESAAHDTEAVVAEVRRLLDVYGSHHSFRRYAQDLLSAHEMRNAEPPRAIVPEADVAGYDVPLQIKAALGARVRDGQEIEPDLLLAYVMSHPETSVRTPAKRALPELRELFSDAVARAYPKGFRVPVGRAKMLKSSYRACSSTFEVDIRPYGGDLPDITGRSKPIETGREIFNACVQQLDAYSRALGRLPGMTSNLAAIARLPAGYRRRRAEQLEGKPLDRIDALAKGSLPCPIEQLIVLTGLDDDGAFGRAKLKDLAAVLVAFGYGITADPAFSMRAAKLGEPVVVFPLGAEVESVLVPSAGYRKVQATIMLGMIVALADGTFDQGERRGLVARIEGATFLPEDERRRLKAELVANEHAPGRMADWMKLLKDMETADSAWVADVLVGAAAADGRVDPQEVAMLEKLFRRLGLDDASLYARLHGGLAAQAPGRDDDLELVVPAGIQPTGPAIPPPPSLGTQDGPRSRVDLSRLEAIRRETRSAAGVLADIFAEEEEVAEPTPPDAEPEDDAEAIFDGLERRYGSLLAELSEREEWTATDFEHLTRDAGLMPGAARQALNDWALDRFDELLIEGEDPIIINRHLLPLPGEPARVSPSADLRAPA